MSDFVGWPLMRLTTYEYISRLRAPWRKRSKSDFYCMFDSSSDPIGRGCVIFSTAHVAAVCALRKNVFQGVPAFLRKIKKRTER
jgi:hypothetical protein